MHRASPRVPAVRLLALVALALAAGCGGAPDPDKVAKTLASWTATVRLARADRQHGRTTRLHATELRDLARSAMDESRRSLAGPPDSGAARRKADVALDSLRMAIGDLDHELLQP